MDRKQTAWLLLIGGGLGIVGGLFLPWATTVFGELYGSEGDGQITAVAGGMGIVAGVLTQQGKDGKGSRVLAVLATLGVGAVGLYDYPNMADAASGSGFAQVGSGLYAVLIGGLLLLIGTVGLFKLKPDAPGLDTQAVGDRAEQLVEDHGMEWRNAWAQAESELGGERVTPDKAQLEARTRELMESEGLSWQEAWGRASREQMRRDLGREFG